MLGKKLRILERIKLLEKFKSANKMTCRAVEGPVKRCLKQLTAGLAGTEQLGTN